MVYVLGQASTVCGHTTDSVGQGGGGGKEEAATLGWMVVLCVVQNHGRVDMMEETPTSGLRISICSITSSVMGKKIGLVFY